MTQNIRKSEEKVNKIQVKKTCRERKCQKSFLKN